MATEQYTAPERFTISHTGMRELNVGRAPWTLVKELIQNSWDEAPAATTCRVSIKAHPKEAATILTVEDDGPGFSNIEDAWTLMRHTDKRSDPRKRGRFNLGEKELISVAMEATVETVGATVVFPRMGGRVTKTNRRRKGTKITAVMPWGADARTEISERLARFRPTDCGLTVNGDEVPKRTAIASRSVVLRTVLQEGPGEPMRDTRRRTNIEILERANADEGWLYEMGIPIQRIDSPWDVDVLQKVPMPPQRDTVSEGYLQDIYAEILNETKEMLDAEQMGESWVKRAINDERTEKQTVEQVVETRYGTRVVLGSRDRDANMKATEAGYEVVNPRSLTPQERDRFRQDAGVQSAYMVFGVELKHPPDRKPKQDTAEGPFAAWVESLGKMAGLTVTVRIIEDADAPQLASCTASTEEPTVRFNVALLPGQFMEQPYWRPEQLALIYHEFGHALAPAGVKHGPSWGEAVALGAGLISAARGD